MNFDILDQSGANLKTLAELQRTSFLQYEREKTALKYYLVGKGYHRAIKALGFIERLEFRVKPEDRFRKDGITPSLHHQVRIALSVTQLPNIAGIEKLEGWNISLEEQCIINALLHDCQEDHGVSRDQIKNEFDVLTEDVNWKLTKKFAGTQKNKEEYIREIALCMIASIVKGLDRLDNLAHMIDVFSINKMEDYAAEAKNVFLPMIKTASKLYPELHLAYTSMALQMKRQIGFTEKYVKMARLHEAEVENVKNLLGVIDKCNDNLVHAFNQNNQKEIEITKLLQEWAQVKLDHEEEINELKEDRVATRRDFFIGMIEMFADALRKQEFSRTFVTDFLSKMSIRLGISALELTEFTADKLSEGTVVINLDKLHK